MKISTWNVNSVRARIDSLIKYPKDAKPDILFLQEIKTEDENFPTDIFFNLGYNSYIYGQKRYNGVAFLSKIEINNIQKDFMTDDKKNHAKLILPGGKTIILPIVEGTIGPKVLDISSLYTFPTPSIISSFNS